MIPRLSQQETVDELYVRYLSELKDSGFKGDIETSFSSRLAVATDNSVYQWLPQAVVFPKCTMDVVTLVKLAGRDEFKEIKFTPRGGGTGTNGQSLNGGVVVDLSRHMNVILDYDQKEHSVRVQPGVVKDQLNAYLKPSGYFFAPELSTSNRATIGGMISTDASGQGSLVYGKTSQHVTSVTAVLHDGSVAEFTRIGGGELKRKLEADTVEGSIYRTVYEVTRGKRAEIEKTFPKLTRFLTGYDLKHAYDPEDGSLDVSRLICGAEGTLAFIVEAKLDLTKIPDFRALVNVKYDSFDSALRNAQVMLGSGCLSVKTVDSKVLNLAKTDIVWYSVKDLLTEVPGCDMQGINIVEFSGDDAELEKSKVQALCRRLDEQIKNHEAGVIGYQFTYDLPSILNIYAMRKKAVGLLGKVEGDHKPIAFTEDTCVPPEHLADYILEFRALLDSKNLSYGMFGHVDSGVLHVRPALDMCDPEEEAMLHEITGKMVELTAKYGGLMWGEHGRGFRSQYGPKYFGSLFDELRKIKGAFDPDNRINPGKICTPIDSSDKLVPVEFTKRGTYDRQIDAGVRHSYEEVMICNGNGACFNYDVNSPMCPSYKLMRDRRNSPKGRATMAREWLRELQNPLAGFMSGKTIGVVDLPALSYPTLSTLVKQLELPVFSLEAVSALTDEQKSRTVLFVQDPFTTCYEADVVRDLLKFIKQIGYTPYVLPFKPNGKAQHVRGFLGMFAKTAENTAQFLNSVAALNIPMIGLDPAMVICYRDEYKKILKDRRGDFKVLLLQEWLLSVLERVEKPAAQCDHQYYLLAHCQEKTFKPSTHNDWVAIFKHFGVSLKPVAVGCCGMAGMYGHEAVHLESSTRIYRQSFGAAIGKYGIDNCAVTGYSCRSQVKRQEGRKVKHPVQILTQWLEKQKTDE